jgi:rRNA-processing protein FCF1
MKNIFLDTNIFLHYKLFDQVNWLEIVKDKSVMIVIPPIIMRELNKYKDLQSQQHIKKRASQVINKLLAIFKTNLIAEIGKNISIRLEDRDPSFNFKKHQLNFDVQDDQLIASMIMLYEEDPKTKIILITSDEGLTLCAKARRQKFIALQMPENLRISDPPDPSQKIIKELEKKILELESRSPNLSLTFSIGNQHDKFSIPIPIFLEQTSLESELEQIKQNFPQETYKPVSSNSIVSKENKELSILLASIEPLTSISKAEISRYNEDLIAFFGRYEKYIKARTSQTNLFNRTLELCILLVNDGTAPAEDIDISMHFPDGLIIVNEEGLPKPIEEPNPPKEPQTTMQQMQNTFPNNVEYPVLRNSFDSKIITPPSNVSPLSIKRTNSFEVSLHVQKAKHNKPEPIDPLYVIFDSYETARSFQIEYRIHAANIPQEISGILHVIIDKVNAQE